MDEKRLRQVSDHAVVRWLERICGHDVDAIRAQILADGRDQAALRIDKGKILARSLGARLVVQNGVIVSVTALRRPARVRSGR